ncbi:universal stress protein [Pontiellaceae bacterium B1224]|nr:universal stress protein [Pontiellaceae bacterium B1224]
MNNLLVAVDFSKSTDAVLSESAKLATALGAKLWIVHVTTDETQNLMYESTQYTGFDFDFTPMPGDIELARDITAEEIKREHDQLLGMTAKLRESGVTTQALILQGNPALAILEKAAELSADMIILGSHGHGLMHKALLGSVSESIIHKSPVKVLIIPSQKE